jgi:copper transport protein
MKWQLGAVALALFILVASAGPAFAHANLVRSDPAPGSVLPTPPTQLVLSFTEALEGGFSGVEILDQSGRRIQPSGTTIAPSDPKVMVVELPGLAEGIYTVGWRVLSAIDGHVTTGALIFGVGNVTLSLPPASAAPAYSTPPAEIGVRWANFFVQTLLVGVVVFQLLIWRPTLRKVPDARAKLGSEFAKSSNRVLARLLRFGILTFFGVLVAQLFVQAAAVGGSDGFLSAVPTVLGGSRLGLVWLARLGIAVGLLGVIVLLPRRMLAVKLWWAAAGLGVALLVTTSLTGHNAAQSFLPVVAQLSDSVHLVAVAAWIGGLLSMVVVLPTVRRQLDAAVRGRLTSLLIGRFSQVAILALTVLGLTGLYQVWLQVGTVPALFSTEYGITLVTKIALVVPMVVLGAFNELRILNPLISLLRRGAQGIERLDQVFRHFSRNVRFEVGLALALLLTVAFLTAVPPAIQTGGAPAPPGQIFQDEAEGAAITLGIASLQVGLNDFRVMVADPTGRPLTDVRDVRLRFQLLDGTLGGSTAQAQPTADGAYDVSGPYLSTPGQWRVEVQVRRETAFDAIVRFEFPVGVPQPIEPRMQEYPVPVGAPFDVQVDNGGQVWFANPVAGRLGRLDPSSGAIAEFDPGVPGANPLNLALDGKGAIWYTAPQINAVVRFDIDGQSAVSYPLATPNATPLAIAIAPDGSIWFTQAGVGRLARLDPSNGDLREFPLEREDAGPNTLGFDSAGMVWFTEVQTGLVGRLDPVTGAIQTFEPQQLQSISFPAGIVVTAGGAVWVSDHGRNRLLRLTPADGQFGVVPFLTDQVFPYELALDTQGNLWFAGHIGNQIGLVNATTNEVSLYRIPTVESGTQAIALDPQGNIWFAEASGGKVGVLLRFELPGTTSAQPGSDTFLTQLVVAGAVALVGLAAFSLRASRRRLERAVATITESRSR